MEETYMKLVQRLRNLTKKQKIIFSVTGVILGYILTFSLYGVITASSIKSDLDQTLQSSRAAYDGVKQQDLTVAQANIEQAETHLNRAAARFNSAYLLKYSAFYWHFQDGEHAFKAAQEGLEAGKVVLAAIEPYADVIGFKGQGSFAGGTTEDRIIKIIETVDKINPSLDEVATKLDSINQEVSAINPNRYPWISFQGKSVADLIGTAKTQISQADVLLAELRPAISVLPEIAGLNQPQKYLILFQNDAELRATGGFLTAYAVLSIDKGKVTPEKSSDIYDLDSKFRQRIAPPDILRTKLNVNTWHLRDMNISPDFKLSMEQFIGYYNELPGETKVDGVITVDTKVLTDLVRILGGIDVPGYGEFTADNDPRCDCPQVFYELENIVGRPTYYIRTDRKAILGPMMQTILQKTYAAPKEVWPELFTNIWENMQQKHVLMYFFNEDFQNAAEMINVAGRIKTYDADYLHINDSNLGGAKSNMFVTQEVEQEIMDNQSTLTKTITITYKNPRKGDNCNLEAGQLCLNGKMPNWTRIYLPKAAEVSEVLGFDNNSVKQYEELDKKVVEGYFELNPESQARIKLTVSIPKNAGSYRQFIQKQPGTKNAAYTITYLGEERLFDLATDQEVLF
jgi:hypothetical protein